MKGTGPDSQKRRLKTGYKPEVGVAAHIPERKPALGHVREGVNERWPIGGEQSEVLGGIYRTFNKWYYIL